MGLYVITYDLDDGNAASNGKKSRYESLNNGIDSIDQANCMLSHSSYMVNTKLTSVEIMKQIENVFDFKEGDKITISKLTTDSVHRKYKAEDDYENDCWR